MIKNFKPFGQVMDGQLTISIACSSVYQLYLQMKP